MNRCILCMCIPWMKNACNLFRKFAHNRKCINQSRNIALNKKYQFWDNVKNWNFTQVNLTLNLSINHGFHALMNLLHNYSTLYCNTGLTNLFESAAITLPRHNFQLISNCNIRSFPYTDSLLMNYYSAILYNLIFN